MARCPYGAGCLISLFDWQHAQDENHDVSKLPPCPDGQRCPVYRRVWAWACHEEGEDEELPLRYHKQIFSDFQHVSLRGHPAIENLDKKWHLPVLSRLTLSSVSPRMTVKSSPPSSPTRGRMVGLVDRLRTASPIKGRADGSPSRTGGSPSRTRGGSLVEWPDLLRDRIPN